MEPITTPKTFFAELLHRDWLANGILELQLRRPATLNYLPGQFMRFHYKDLQRDYSLISHPDAESMDFCIAVVDGGVFSNRLARAEVGDTFQLSGPHGRFVYHRSNNPAVLVATGTGIAPFVSFCRTEKKTIALLLHGVASTEHLVFSETLQKSVDCYMPCVSHPAGMEDRGEGLYAGRVTDYLEQSLEKGAYDFYLCGRRSMIRDAVRIIDTRFEGSRLFIETYD